MPGLSKENFLEKFTEFSRATVVVFSEILGSDSLTIEKKYLVFPLLGVSVVDQQDGISLQRPDFKIDFPITEIETISEQEQGLCVVYKPVASGDGQKYFNSKLMIKGNELRLTVGEFSEISQESPILQQKEFEDLKRVFVKRLGKKNLDLSSADCREDGERAIFISRVKVKDGYYANVSREESSAVSIVYTWVEVYDKKLVFVSKPSCNLTPEEKLKLKREKVF